MRSFAFGSVLLAGLLVTSCSADAVREEAEGIAGAAADSASTAAVQAVRDQVCQVVADRQVSGSDLEVLQNLVDAAQAAGVESDVLTALEDVAGTDGTPPASAVARLADACR